MNKFFLSALLAAGISSSGCVSTKPQLLTLMPGVTENDVDTAERAQPSFKKPVEFRLNPDLSPNRIELPDGRVARLWPEPNAGGVVVHEMIARDGFLVEVMPDQHFATTKEGAQYAGTRRRHWQGIIQAHKDSIKRAEREAYLAANPTVSEQVRDALLDGAVVRGMDHQAAELAWGKPAQRNITQGGFGRHEQWVYEHPGRNEYLYFKNGVLDSWQLSR